MSPEGKAAGRVRKRPRGSLNAEEIVTAAIEIIMADGIDALNMSRLAQHLNAGVMSIYGYFDSKDDLLAAVAERAFTEMFSGVPPAIDAPWQDEVIALSKSLHRRLLEAPLFLTVCRARPRSLFLAPDAIPTAVARLEAELQAFQPTGLDLTEAARYVALLSAYARGFALMQLGVAEETEEATPEEALESLVSQLNEAKFPILRAVTDPGTIVSVTDRSFDTGLRFLVAGLEAELESAATTKQ